MSYLGTERPADGDVVSDFLGNIGVVCVGRMTGAVSVRWDDDPDVLEHCVDWTDLYLVDGSGAGRIRERLIRKVNRGSTWAAG